MTNTQQDIASISAGVATTWTAGIVSFAVTITPLFQLFALVLSIVAGALTTVWTWKKIRLMDIEAGAKIATKAVEATAAVITASAVQDLSKDG